MGGGVRTGIISDVHGNEAALDAVLRALHARAVDRILSLGDIVGYGGDPEACVARVRTVVAESTLGNHDAAAAGVVKFEAVSAEGEVLLRQARESLSQDSLAWLRKRPFVHDEGGVRYCHGDPLIPEAFRYVLTVEQATELTPYWSELPALSFIGHSHVERSFRLWPNGAAEVLSTRLRLDGRHKYVVNVGSVGQPRDRDPRAAAAIYDDEKRTVTFLRVEYDVAHAAARIRRAGLPEFFASRIFRGL